jgi:two-component system, NtrC family, sensor kinase
MDESEIKTVDLHDGLNSTLMMMEHLWKGDGTGEAKIKIHRNYGDLPPINCYAGEINQAFMHLLNNAIDALQCSNLENPQIWIETAPVLGSQAEIDRVTVTIRDNGVGIAETIRQQIFDPFFTTKPVGQGTGMGLALSYQIVVQRHSGQLEYQPNQPQGSAFSITIPTTLT